MSNDVTNRSCHACGTGITDPAYSVLSGEEAWHLDCWDLEHVSPEEEHVSQQIIGAVVLALPASSDVVHHRVLQRATLIMAEVVAARARAQRRAQLPSGGTVNFSKVRD